MERDRLLHGAELPAELAAEIHDLRCIVCFAQRLRPFFDEAFLRSEELQQRYDALASTWAAPPSPNRPCPA